MKLLDRLSNLVRSNLNAALDKMSDPAKEIDLLIEEMDTETKKARVELRDQIAQEKIFQKRVDEHFRSVQRWQQHAERAVQAGEDDLAREALRRQQEAERQLEAAEGELSSQSHLVVQLTDKLRSNDRKLAEIKGRKETLKARARISQQALRPDGNAFDRFDQLANQIEVSEHQVEALAEMNAELSPGTSAGREQADMEVAARFDRLLPGKSDKDRDLDDRLAALKARLDKSDADA